MADPNADTLYDAIIIGSGPGGAMAAHVLVGAGMRVLLLERGDWVERGPANWELDGAWELSPHYLGDAEYRLRTPLGGKPLHMLGCVGGQSVFSGAVAIRFREGDFEPAPEIVGDSGAAWPYGYADLEPYYGGAERILHVSGSAGEDPTEPRRGAPYPQPPAPMVNVTRRLVGAATRLGMRPFRLPLAIAYAPRNGGAACRPCLTCDAHPCAIGAKNDAAVAVIEPLLGRGLELRTNTVAVRLAHRGRRITAVECVDRVTGEQVTLRARRFVIAAGVLGSPHLLLASGLERLNPGGTAVGRYLLRHCNAMLFGLFVPSPNPGGEFHKQFGVNDYYFGHPRIEEPRGKLGCIQQVMPPSAGLVTNRLPRTLAVLDQPLRRPVGEMMRFTTGLLVIAEDQPRAENHVALSARRRNRYGQPQLVITHRYSARDEAARTALAREAARVLRAAGAKYIARRDLDTFSHAVGTVRMGEDPATSALDGYGAYRGVDNLHVLDGSVMPTAAGVNPTLTIAANALRGAEQLVRTGG